MGFDTVFAVHIPFVSLKESFETAQKEDCWSGGKLSKLHIEKARAQTIILEP